MSKLTLREISEVLLYQKDSGKFYWKRRTGGVSQAGEEASGTIDSKGYVRIGVLGEIHRAHRLAWLLSTGEWPTQEIDHKNGDKCDNSIDNLREASRDINQQNQRAAYKNSKTGLLGVCLHKPSQWRARICVEGKSKSLGLFNSPEAAHAAYLLAKRKNHKGCTL